MRQLKGGKSKESRKEKQERKKEIIVIEKQIKTVVLPTLAVLCLVIFLYVFLKTRPIAVLDE